MIAIKNLTLHVNTNKSFTSDGMKYKQGQDYYIMCECSDDDPSDIINTTDWVLKMIEKGNFTLLDPKSFLPESNKVDKELIPYMFNLIEYIKNNLI